MLEKIVAIDHAVLIYLNNLGSSEYDRFWLYLTKFGHWWPLFALLLYGVYREYGVKKTLIFLLCIALLITFTDQVTNLFKHGFQRLRPCNNPDINFLIRVVKDSNSFSFFSGHAANTTAVAVFLYQVFKPKYRYLWLLFAWPIVFAYSRIYLGLHFPSDILCGFLFGMLTGNMMYVFYKKYLNACFFRDAKFQK